MNPILLQRVYVINQNVSAVCFNGRGRLATTPDVYFQSIFGTFKILTLPQNTVIIVNNFPFDISDASLIYCYVLSIHISNNTSEKTCDIDKKLFLNF